MEKRIYCIGSNSNGYWIDNGIFVDSPELADIVVFPGGSDVCPENYGCKDLPEADNWPSARRDEEEIEIFNSMKPTQMAIGICRGHQLLATRFGGILVQDCSGHWGSTHEIVNNRGHKVMTNSYHHQMVYLPSLDPSTYELLYWSSTKLSSYYIGDKIDADLITKEPEIIMFQKEGMPRSLGIQGHPEMMSPNNEFVKVVNKIVNKYF